MKLAHALETGALGEINDKKLEFMWNGLDWITYKRNDVDDKSQRLIYIKIHFPLDLITLYINWLTKDKNCCSFKKQSIISTKVRDWLLNLKFVFILYKISPLINSKRIMWSNVRVIHNENCITNKIPQSILSYTHDIEEG